MNDESDTRAQSAADARRRFLDESRLLIREAGLSSKQAERLFTAAGFDDPITAGKRLGGLCCTPECRDALGRSLSMLLVALSDASNPDRALVNLERFMQAVADRTETLRHLKDHPRAVEILVRLFGSSQFLTEILVRNPVYLEELTQQKRLAEHKSRRQMAEQGMAVAAKEEGLAAKFDALRRYQRWELLRIGACDCFRLMDLKSVTVQLSLLADSLVQNCLAIVADDLGVPTDDFAVLAFGKLGGEELNYSSDIDLVFVAKREATRFWELGQKLINALLTSTTEGFLYRVDMRLRPWGRSGALVGTVESHLDYLRKHAMLWERQALLKSRPIAGNRELGEDFLRQAQPQIFGADPEEIRESVRDMKARIEAELNSHGRKWGHVKSGQGSIRDIEFIAQLLQLRHGGTNPEVRSVNTLEALVRLADFGYLKAQEYQQLTSGYVFLRTIEHSLQLMYNKQEHALPEDHRELAYLAGRLDFPDVERFLIHYERHCTETRAIFERYVEGKEVENRRSLPSPGDLFADHRARMEPSYGETFTDDEIAQHGALLARLTDENIVEVEATLRDDGQWQVTVAGFDRVGDLSIICGLLFVHGFNITDGNVFTAEQVSAANGGTAREHRGPRKNRESVEPSPKFVDVFTVRPPGDTVGDSAWRDYRDDLAELMRLSMTRGPSEAQGVLAKRVAEAVRDLSGSVPVLYPVEIDIDNGSSERFTVLHIRAEDTIGFLYELTSALTLSGIDISRVIVGSAGNRVYDTLYVQNEAGGKILDANRLEELRAAIVLIKHFSHLLPRSPNPESSLLRFREFLEQLFQQPNWVRDLSSLERSEVLHTLARVLGVSDFLWEDFLRLQHANLFPVVTDIEALARRTSRAELESRLAAYLDEATSPEERRSRLNAFKDREMFRIDLRHIMGHISEFGMFSEELTELAEVVVVAAVRFVDDELRTRYGTPRLDETGEPCPVAVCALGKCGGRELGYASDIELMFVYQGNGRSDGDESITTAEYFQKLVETFRKAIRARQEGIFQVDLRLRPYGRAGSLAVARDAFRSYFAPEGAAWPYERQALVKLRPIAGDRVFGERIIALRDELLYTGAAFDIAAMRAMREKQVAQLVRAGTINAKLSPGGLVDCEYTIQGLQISHGNEIPTLRTTNTLEAMSALASAGLLSPADHERLSEAYVFLRRLIDALRMVRGNARDLTVPASESEEFQYLARRLRYGDDLPRLQQDLERAIHSVRELGRLLDNSPARAFIARRRRGNT